MSRPAHRVVAAWVFTSALVLLCGVDATEPDAAVARDLAGEAHVVNGLLTPMYPTVGGLLVGDDPETARTWCTGTLVGCDRFLIAAHCVCAATGVDCQGGDAPDPAGYFVFLQHAGFFRVAHIAVHPEFDFPRADLALLTLARPVAGITPVRVNAVGTPVAGTLGTIVGFGRSGGSRYDYGLKRYGDVFIADPGDRPSGLISWRFTDPIGPPGTNANTCNGDSGGPLFVDVGSGEVLAGVTSGGDNGTCLADDVSYDTDVFVYRDWIRAVAGGDEGCAAPAGAGSSGRDLSFAGELPGGGAGASHAFEVPPGTRALRVTFNAVDDGQSDFNLSVHSGDDAGSADAGCRQDGPGQYGACAFDAPVPGTWYAVIERASGSGLYQLTVTLLGSGGRGPSAPRCETAPPQPCQAPSPPRRASLFLRDAAFDGDDALRWRWVKGGPAAKADFGDPTARTSFALCIYRHTRAGSSLVMEQIVPAGRDWREMRRGFAYTRRSPGGGIDRVLLKAGRAGRTGVVVEGAGEALGLNRVGLDPGERLAVRLRNETACWEARYRGDLGSAKNHFGARAE